MIGFRSKLQPLVPILAIAEPLALLLAAPLLLFPTVRPGWTAAALALLALLALARWAAAGELWPATPFDAALLLFALTLPVAWWATAAADLSWPKLMGIVLGLLAFRALALGIRDRRTLGWGFAAFAAAGAGITAVGSLGASWSAKFAPLRPLVQRLPRLLTDLPGAPDAGVNANQLAGALLLYLPFCLALALGYWREGRRGPALAGLAGLAACGGVLLLTQSRSGWLGAAAALAAFALLGGLTSRRPPLRLAARVLLAVGVVALVAAPIILGSGILGLGPAAGPAGAPGTLDGLSQISLAGRIEIWSRALYAIQDFPFTGVGLGAFRRVVNLLYPLFTIGPDVDIAHAHNIFLQVALDVGLPGLIAYLALLWVAAALGWRTARQAPPRQGSPLTRALALGLLAGLAGLHVYGLTDALALGSKPGIAFWMALGLLAGLQQVTFGRRFA